MLRRGFLPGLIPALFLAALVLPGQAVAGPDAGREARGAAARGGAVLALYKSSEGQSERENEIFFYLSRPLAEMGLKVHYRDVDAGLPREEELEGVRALISWFRGPSMSQPERYLELLERSMDRGLKLLVFDNFGAYQDRDSGQYVPASRLNLTLSRLGILYFGDWTQDPAVLRVSHIDSAMVEQGGRQRVKESRFFYRFLQLDRDLKVYLALRRSDRSYAESPVIVANRHGAFALSRYIYRVEEGRVRMLLDLRAFLREALFPAPAGERVALLADDTDPTAARVLGYAVELLRRAKLPFEVIRRQELPELLPGDLRRFTAVALLLRDDAGLEPGVLEDFLAGGGGVVSLVGGAFRRLAPWLAMEPAAGSPQAQTGYRFREGFVLGEGLILEHEDFRWRSGTNLPAADAEILAASYRGNAPLAWAARRREGRVLAWAWDAFAVGDFQGLLLESLLRVRPVGVAAVAGLGLFFLDDWPLPMFNTVKPPLSIEDTEFYTRRWWPDIKRLLDSRKIPFASFLVFNYNARTSPPFGGGEFFVARDQAGVAIAREILESGRELGLHGYNHVSLTLRPTRTNVTAWPSQEAMEGSLRAARRQWAELFGEHALPFAYVAPNNIIDEAGIRAVHQIFPSIKVLSLLRSGSGEEATSPFAPHPGLAGLYDIPRNSSGYPLTAYKRLLIAAAASGPGIWSHFVHADDVYDPTRSQGMSWEELRAELEKTLDFTATHYPWLRFVTLREAYQELLRLDAIAAEFRWEGDGRLTVRSSAPGLLLRLRLDGYRLRGLEGAHVCYAYRRMPALIVETERPTATLFFEK